MGQKTLKQEAQAYESQRVGNISELPSVSTDLVVEDKTGVDKNGEAYNYKVVLENGKEYRVPASVLRDLKSMLEESPNLKRFRVKKSGVGLDTEYMIIPLP